MVELVEMDSLQTVFCTIDLLMFLDRWLLLIVIQLLIDLVIFRSNFSFLQSSMVFYENSGLHNLYDIARYCQVRFISYFLRTLSKLISWVLSAFVVKRVFKRIDYQEGKQTVLKIHALY